MARYIICKNCGVRLSNLLNPTSQIQFAGDGETALPQQTYFIDETQNIFTHVEDKFGLIPHKDLQRYAGCCGASVEGLPNLLCYHC